MATKTNKCTVEVLLVGAELSGFPDRMPPVSRNLGTTRSASSRTSGGSSAPSGGSSRG